MPPAAALPAPLPAPARREWLVASGVVAAACLVALWTLRTYWNPLFFFGLWTGATVFVRAASGQRPWPWRRQLALMALSAPLWWWFELVNETVQNWHYHGVVAYDDNAYLLFATLAFSTVAPALDAAWTAALHWWPERPTTVSQVPVRLPSPAGRGAGGEGAAPAAHSTHGASPELPRTASLALIATGLFWQAAVFLWPTYAYSFTWTAPFLVFDGLASITGGVSLVACLWRRQWRLPLAIAAGGLACGFCWEFWNFWAMPKWTYTVPHLQFLQVFEMPLLGYGGYVPFAWSAYQVVALCERAIAALRRTTGQQPDR